MVVDRRVARLQVNRAFEFFDRLVVFAEPEIGPAQTVDDVAIAGAQLDGLVQHLEGFIEIFAAVDPAVAEIVQHQRLVGIERQRFTKVGDRLGPFVLTLVGDTAEVKERPFGLLRFLRRGERLGIGVDGCRILLVVALRIAERE